MQKERDLINFRVEFMLEVSGLQDFNWLSFSVDFKHFIF